MKPLVLHRSAGAGVAGRGCDDRPYRQHELEAFEWHHDLVLSCELVWFDERDLFHQFHVVHEPVRHRLYRRMDGLAVAQEREFARGMRADHLHASVDQQYWPQLSAQPVAIPTVSLCLIWVELQHRFSTPASGVRGPIARARIRCRSRECP